MALYLLVWAFTVFVGVQSVKSEAMDVSIFILIIVFSALPPTMWLFLLLQYFADILEEGVRLRVEVEDSYKPRDRSYWLLVQGYI